jgi:hypothetical protein
MTEPVAPVTVAPERLAAALEDLRGRGLKADIVRRLGEI